MRLEQLLEHQHQRPQLGELRHARLDPVHRLQPVCRADGEVQREPARVVARGVRLHDRDFGGVYPLRARHHALAAQRALDFTQNAHQLGAVALVEPAARGRALGADAQNHQVDVCAAQRKPARAAAEARQPRRREHAAHAALDAAARRLAPERVRGVAARAPRERHDLLVQTERVVVLAFRNGSGKRAVRGGRGRRRVLPAAAVVAGARQVHDTPTPVAVSRALRALAFSFRARAIRRERPGEPPGAAERVAVLVHLVVAGAAGARRRHGREERRGRVERAELVGGVGVEDRRGTGTRRKFRVARRRFFFVFVRARRKVATGSPRRRTGFGRNVSASAVASPIRRACFFAARARLLPLLLRRDEVDPPVAAIVPALRALSLVLDHLVDGRGVRVRIPNRGSRGGAARGGVVATRRALHDLQGQHGVVRKLPELALLRVEPGGVDQAHLRRGEASARLLGDDLPQPRVRARRRYLYGHLVPLVPS